ncbi:MAG: cyanoexosortase A, partial [Waterburya sp.]
MYIKNIVSNHRWWLFSSLIGVAILYLNLIWKTTGDIDQLTTDLLFWGTIFWLLWRKKDVLKYDSDFISSFLGLILLGLILAKTLTLFWFESSLLSLLPFSGAIALSLIASGFTGLGQYIQELFFAWFLFF